MAAVTEADSKKRRLRRKTVPTGAKTGADYSAVMIPSQEIRVLVIGSRASGKTALLGSHNLMR